MAEERDKSFFIVKLLLVVVVLSVIVIVTTLRPAMITLADYTVGAYVELFTPFVLVALLIERALEVLLTTWRGPKSAELERSLTRIRSRAATQKGGKKQEDVNNESSTTTNEAETALWAYKSVTQRTSFTLAVLSGIIVSLLGMRALEMLFDADALAVLPDYQQSTFRVVDVLITGFLLGGGADGIHKVLSLFTTYMDETKRKVKE